ncbi:hypothetical protein CUJ83_10575 [Methanocella sp. CWC-04]|uniref:Uncharacterized protein n=1 Tax=Methanooceanicella nereidis TaxID=2052831 RepID=A0AAP2RDE0_9EURY|nr:PAS domain-containing protein [Methanocella sp. CWC-04]MCD1295443.1 hypothetical protein [Methanocella sp. CWC-04]
MENVPENLKTFKNAILFLIIFQCLIVMGMVTFLLYSFVGEYLSIVTVISAMLLLMVCLPVSIHLYLSAKEKDLKTLFKYMVLNFLLLSISGIIWYLVPASFNWHLLPYIGKMLMLIACGILPLSLLIIIRHPQIDIRPVHKYIAVLLNIAAGIGILYFIMANIGGSGNYYDIFIYGLCIFIDTGILIYSAFLIMAYSTPKFRYAFFIWFLFFFFSIIGDSFNLLGYMGLYDTLEYSQIFYDVMLILGSAGLILYSMAYARPRALACLSRKHDRSADMGYERVLTVPGSMCVCDHGGNAVMMSDSFIDMLKLSGNRRQMFNILMYAGASIDGQKAIKRIREGDAVTINGIKYFDEKDGSRILSLKVFPMFSNDGKISSYIAVAEENKKS